MIHALPGMGADHRMYQGAWLTLPNFVAHDWPVYHGEKTLAQVAQSVCNEYNVQDGDILVGSSLGGMVACEMTKIRNIPQLFLVGSAISRDEVGFNWLMLRHLIHVMPIELMKAIAGKITGGVFNMFADSNASFIRAMCSTIITRDGLQTTPTRVYRIHGNHDRVIPLPKKVDLVLDAGHLIAMTHKSDCADYIRQHLYPEIY